MQISGIFKMIIALMVLVNSVLLFTSCTSSSINNLPNDSQSIDKHSVHRGHGGGGGGSGGGR